MAVTFVGAGAIAGNNTLATQNLTSHANTAVGDLLIAQVINKSVTANTVTPPDGTWFTIIATEVNDCTTAADDHQYSLFGKFATVAGAQAYTFTKATDDNVLFAGVLSTWRGVDADFPLDDTAAARTETAGAADNVSFPAYNPTRTNVHVVYMAYYGNDLTTFAAAMSNDTNPDCTTRYDLESSTGNDCGLACTSGDNDGSNVASRTWASAATTNAGNTGVVFALRAAAVAGDDSVRTSLSSLNQVFPVTRLYQSEFNSLTPLQDIEAGDGSASGTGAATAVGTGIVNADGSASGTGAATAVGESTAASTATASGTGAATGVGESTAASDASASGTGAATGIGASTAAADGSASGTGAATAVGAAIYAATGTASGTGEALGVGASTAAATASASVTGEALGVGASTAASTASASGTGTLLELEQVLLLLQALHLGLARP
jgi:hypothetical protein